MGIHIIPYYLVGKEERSWGNQYSYWHLVEHPSFQGGRMVGDKDFIYTEEIDWMRIVDDEEEKYSDEYRRPVDFDKAICWVKSNVPECNQSRLVDLINEMRENEKLYIYVSH